LSNKQLFMVITISSIALVICLAIIIGGWWLFYRIETPTDYLNSLNTPTPPIVTVAPPPASTAIATPPPTTPLPPAANLAETALLQAILPIRDQRLLAMRLKYHGQEVPEVVNQSAPLYELGSQATFWVTDNFENPPRQFQTQAKLKYITSHAYWWVEDGFNTNPDDLQRSAERFERETYLTNRAFFGSEWSPGIDGDVHAYILMGNIPGVAGYYAAANSYSKMAELYSNEHEMFFINLNAIQPGNSNFDAVLAHEFQHMIHWNQDRNEDTWVNEGLSELAAFINGYGPSSYMGPFLAQPNLQLNNWEANVASHYGASFLFMAYFLEHYGEDTMKAVVADPHNGVAGFNAVLIERGQADRFDDIFGNFVIANYLQNPQINQGKWGYTSLSPNAVTVHQTHQTFPVEQAAQVHQYGSNYIELFHNKPLTIQFSGAPTVSVINNQAHSGQYQWYSHRGDDTNTRLTHAFDLSGVTAATLNYAIWYDIEADWDYGYVEASTDEGKTWTVLTATHSSTTNPSGNAYGAGYTGSSNGWQAESINLSHYAGQKIMVRFEYVTDDAVNQSGWAIDDVTIPEIGFSDDMEQGDNTWQAEGFVRITNSLPQHFKVQVIEIGTETTVHALTLDEQNQGQYTIAGLGSTVKEAVLVISGLTPVTSESASYRYQISQ